MQNTPRKTKKLLDKYVCVWIPNNIGIDLALWDRDWHNASYWFLTNSKEHIYMRYGGRDAASAETYVNFGSLNDALEKGLEQHKLYKAGKLKKQKKPKAEYPTDIELLNENFIEGRRKVGRNARCVECHAVADYRLQHLQAKGKLDKRKEIWRFPEIKKIGINLDVKKGLVIKQAKDAIKDDGVKDGDEIIALNGQNIFTYADLHWWYGKVDRDAKEITLTIKREKDDSKTEQAGDEETEDFSNKLEELAEKKSKKKTGVFDLKVKLPKLWWYTDVGFRYWSLVPLVGLNGEPLTAEEKKGLNLKENGFGFRVTQWLAQTKVRLKPDDIIYAIDGVEVDKETGDDFGLFIKLRKNPGDKIKVKVLRNGEKKQFTLTLFSHNYRKPSS